MRIRMVSVLVLCFMALLVHSAAAQERQPNTLINGDFAQADDSGAPKGWSHRTKGQGRVITHDADAGSSEPAFVEIAVNQPGEDSFIQQTIPLSDEVKSVAFECQARYENVEAGEKGHMKAQIQFRFTKDGKETGAWHGLGGFTGTKMEWQPLKKSAGKPADANGVMLRLALYGVKSGRLDIANVTMSVRTAADVAADVAKYRPSEPFGEPVPESRFARLRQGININNWFCQPWNIQVNGKKGGFNAETFAAYITEHDMKLIKGAGFDHIRLPVDPVFLMDPKTGELKTELLPEFDKALAMIRAHDLAVIVDVHPKSPAFKGMNTKPELAEAFVKWWGLFAKHLASTDPEWLIIEPMNEPGGQGFWSPSYPQRFQDKLMFTIRASAPAHTIIATSGGYMLVDDLLKITEVYPDRNVIWAVHYYHPSPFTHQGAIWMKDWYRPLRNVPWPLTVENLDSAIAGLDRGGKNAGYAAQTEKVLRDQVNKGYSTAAYLRQDMQKIVEWSKKHDRKIVIGEFGVYEKYAPRDGRIQYLKDVTAAMREAGIGWSKWDYVGGGFQIVTDPKAASENRVLDMEVIQALGMKP